MKFLFLLCFTFGVIAARGQNMKLLDCVDYALENRIELKKLENNIILSKQNLIYSKYNLLPSLNIETSHNFTKAKDFTQNQGDFSLYQTGSYSLKSQLVIFDGMQSILKIKQTALLNERGKIELDIAKYNIKSEVIYAYFELLLAIENNRIITHSLEIILQQMQVIQEMVEQGKISVIDLHEIKARYVNGQNDLLQNELNIKKARILLKKTINFPLELDLQIAESKSLSVDFPEMSLKDYYNLAIELFPQIQLIKHDSISIQNNISITKGQYLPYLTTSASLYSSYSNVAINPSSESYYHFNSQFKNNLASQAGFSLVIPIYNKHSVKQKVVDGKIELNNIILDKLLIEKKVYREIETFFETIRLQKERITSLEEESKLYAQIYEMRKEQYTLGKLSITDLILSENKKVNSELKINLEKQTLYLNTTLFNLHITASK